MRIPVIQASVRIEFTDGTSLDAGLYISATARVQDVLNDERLFFPVNVQGRIELINKGQIRRMIRLDD